MWSVRGFCLLVLLHLSSAAVPCKFPPSLWCSSREIAAQCQVITQCEEHFKRKGDAESVSLGLYIESLCPDCKKFISDQLWPTWGKLKDIINLTIIPYGNAREQWDGKQWQFQCQHGAEECMGNLIETCAISSVNFEATKYFPFINCVESSQDLPSKVAANCASTFQLDFDSIMKCVNSSKGNALEHQMALKTNALNPPHVYVPWVTINGVHTEAMQTQAMENLLKLICDTYKGTPPPPCASRVPSFACTNDLR